MGRSGEAGLSLDEGGSCVLKHSTGIEIGIQWLEDEACVIVYAAVCALLSLEAKVSTEELLRDLLTLNLSQIRRPGGSIGLDPQTQHVVFACRRDLRDIRGAEDFGAFVGAFTERAIDLENDIRSLLVKHSI
jgi:hypothetical protein